MAIKFPLEMREGIQVRNILELREHFDIEKVVGYFIDGKLVKWLEARYYEDEASAIENLDVKEPMLEEKICEILGVEYEKKTINRVEILEKNKKIAKLKQYTDDEEIIKNVDMVAFNQEELAELFDIGAEKIYLCEGPFKIPKSKKELNYIKVGMVKVEGVNIDRDIEERMTCEIEEQKDVLIKSSISQELADVIGEREYAESEDYVVWEMSIHKEKEYLELDKAFFKKKKAPYFQRKLNVWNKKSDEYFSVELNGEKGSPINQFMAASKRYGFVGNRLIVCNNFIRIYEIENRELRCIFERRVKSNIFSVSGENVAYRPECRDNNISTKTVNIITREVYRTGYNDNNGSINILNINSMEEYDTGCTINEKDIKDKYNGKFFLDNKMLVFVKGGSVYKYDIESRTVAEKVFEMSNIEKEELVCYGNTIFIKYYNSNTREGKLISCDTNGVVEYVDEVGEYAEAWYANEQKLFILRNYDGFYFLDLQTRKMEFLDCDYVISQYTSRVGNYLYFRENWKELNTHRIDLLDINKGAVRIV